MTAEQYFYENYVLINGKKPVVRDIDRAYFEMIKKSYQSGVRIKRRVRI